MKECDKHTLELVFEDFKNKTNKNMCETERESIAYEGIEVSIKIFEKVLRTGDF